MVTGNRPRPKHGGALKGRHLTFSVREEIARARWESMRGIARRLERRPSTVSRELRRNAGCVGQSYKATTAHALAYERAGSRPTRPLEHGAGVRSGRGRRGAGQAGPASL
ncbi:MAG: helix-turn-helix domain-containing protein [Solirubrobacteraceae bacterium]